jgi:hypothetical protein
MKKFKRWAFNLCFFIFDLKFYDKCTELALNVWPNEPEQKEQWAISRDTTNPAWQRYQG